MIEIKIIDYHAALALVSDGASRCNTCRSKLQIGKTLAGTTEDTTVIDTPKNIESIHSVAPNGCMNRSRAGNDATRADLLPSVVLRVWCASSDLEAIIKPYYVIVMGLI